MKLCLLTLALGLVSAASLFGINASPIPIDLQQPDGTAIRLYVRGDEYVNWFEDEQGYSVVRNGTQYVYASLAADGRLAATALQVGGVDPAAAGLAKRLTPTVAAVRDARIQKLPPALRAAAAASPSGGIDAVEPPTAVSPVGTVKNLVILCQFSDHDGTKIRSQADFNTICNAVGGDATLAPTGSVKDYYTQVSYGTMTLQSTVVAWVTLPHTEAYYANGSSGLGGSYPANPQGMVEDALNLADTLVDFGQFDSDNDGYVDAIDIIHSGYAAETGGGSGNWIWSHKWSLWALAGGQWTSKDNNANSVKVKVYDYHTEAALWGTSGSGITRIGVICHETGHFFGLPDLYDTSAPGQGIGSYCLMANSWGFDNSQQHPPHLSAWCKIQLGWVTPTVVSGGTLSAARVMDNKTIFRVNTGFPSTEYLLIENRQPAGFENIMPQGGLCIWHIDDAKADNTTEGYPGQSGWPTNGKHYKVALLQADGLYEMEKNVNRGNAGDVYQGNGVSSITPVSTPNTQRYQGGTVAATNTTISGISTAGNPMTFTISNSTYPAISSPITATGQQGVPFSYQIVAANTPTSYTASGLPSNVTVNTTNGLISGTPNVNGTFKVTLTATNATGLAASTLTITLASGNASPTATNLSTPETYIEDTALNLTDIAVSDIDNTTVTATLTLTNAAAGSLNTGTSHAVNSNYNPGTGVWSASGQIADVNVLLAGLTFTPAANFNSTFNITTNVTDGVSTPATGTKIMTGTAVNDAPTLAAISDPSAILEDAGAQTVGLSGITAGVGESQTLTVTATSNNPGLIPDPTVTYTSPNTTGSLSYTPVANVAGTATITVTVTDNGGTANSGLNTTFRTFTVNVTAVNDVPTLATIVDPAAIPEDAGVQTVGLTGITAGVGESQTLTVTATSGNTGLIPDPTVTYTSPNATGSLSYTPVANASGTALITVTVTDNGGNSAGGIDTTSRTFTVTVNPVNDQPTLNAINAPTPLAKNSALQTISLSGITAGPGENDPLTVTATSNTPTVIPNPTVTYSSPDSTGSLSFTPVADATGVATITVTVDDGQGTDHAFSRTFDVTVLGPNTAPSFTAGGDVIVTQDDGPQSLPWATDISPGSLPAEAGQAVNFIVTNDNGALFSSPPKILADGTLTFTPAGDADGEAVVTVKAHDNGGTLAPGDVDTSAPQTFTISVTAFDEEVGTYNGLALPAAGATPGADKTGLLKFTMSKKGKFTGKLKLGKFKFTLKGSVDNGGAVQFGRDLTPTATLKRKNLSDLVLTLQVDVSGGSNTLTGTVTDAGDPFAEITADRALYTSKRNAQPPLVPVPGELVGKYTVLFGEPLAPNLPAEEVPHGDGFATLSVSKSGMAKLTGKLADGSKISYGNALSQQDFLPLWVSLAKGAGALAGPVHFQTLPAPNPSNIDGLALRWFKPENLDADRFPNGWPLGITTDLLGSTYRIPPRDTPDSVLPGLEFLVGDADGNAKFSRTGGGMPDWAKALSITVKNKVHVVNEADDKAKVTIAASSGLLKGSFVPPNETKAVKFQGVIFQVQKRGSGYFLGPNEVGAVKLVPAATPGVP